MGKLIPVQIIGTQRSGSNLLRLMLNQLEGVFAPHPPHILSTFFPLLPFYRELDSDRNFKKLITDIADYVRVNPVPWKEPELDPDLIFACCKKRTLLEIFIRIYELNALKKKAGFWFCKSMQNVYYIQHFEENGFSPFYIHLVRDGRDVSLSFQKAIVGEKHIYHLSARWKEDQELSRYYVNHFGPQRAIQVKYEDLIRFPEREIKKICSLIGLHYSNNILKFYQSEDSILAASSGDMWHNLTHPLIRDNFNKYLKEMSESEIQIFETIAGETLAKFDYQRVFHNGTNIHFTAGDIELYTRENENLKKKILQQTGHEDLVKRIPQEELIRRIKSVK